VELDVSFRLRTAGGDRWYRIRGSAPTGDGTSLTLAGSFQDVDELHRAQDRNAYLAAIVDSADDAVIGLDRDAVIVAWNGGADRLFARDGGAMLGQPMASLAPWVRLDVLPDLLPRALRGEAVTGQIIEHRRDDGERLELDLRLAPIRDARG